MEYETGSAEMGVMGIIFMLIYLAVIVVVIAGLWKVFVKADKPGWACIIPIYNIIVLTEIVGRPIWWAFVSLICFPFIWIMYVDLAKSFGKTVGYGIGIILLPFVFIPLLGFGDAEYIGPQAG